MDLSYMGAKAPNIDHETGIRYAWIPAGRVSSEAIEDIMANGRDLSWEGSVEELKDQIAEAFADVDLEGSQEETKVSFMEAMRPLIEEQAGKDRAGRLVRAAWLAWDGPGAGSGPLTSERIRESVTEVWDEIGGELTEGWEMGSSVYLYEQDGYKILFDTDSNDLCVERSPYVAKRGLGSPCIPNGCYLLTPGDYECYALGPDWFSDEDLNPIPYEVTKREEKAP